MPNNPRIASVTIGPPKVTATFEDGSTKELFDYFPDEISFTEASTRRTSPTSAPDTLKAGGQRWSPASRFFS